MNTKNLPNLDASVMAALNFFIKNPPVHLQLQKFKFPLVVGSGNAYHTAQALFAKRPAVIANESSFAQIIKNYQKSIKNKNIDQALIISASGEKDSVWELQLAKKYKLKTTLLTCSPNSPAAQIADQVFAYQKVPEPYTYNISTYLGMFLSSSTEKAQDIKIFIEKLTLPRLLRDYKNYLAYTFILPDKFEAIVEMLRIKKDELFGPYLSIRAFTFGEARHAKFVHPWKKELVISFGENKYFGNPSSRWEIVVPSSATYALMMAASYYLVGKIQAVKTPYFKRHLAKFCKEGVRPYGQKKPFPIIVN